MAYIPTCTGSPSLISSGGALGSGSSNTLGYQWPNGTGASGYVCTTPPFGPYSAPRFAQCCNGTVHNITQPTDLGDISYPASCVAWCYVDPAFDQIGYQSPSNPYGFTPYFLCLNPSAASSNDGDDDGNGYGDTFSGTVGTDGTAPSNSTSDGGGQVVCGFVNDAAQESFWATNIVTQTWDRISAQESYQATATQYQTTSSIASVSAAAVGSGSNSSSVTSSGSASATTSSSVDVTGHTGTSASSSALATATTSTSGVQRRIIQSTGLKAIWSVLTIATLVINVMR